MNVCSVVSQLEDMGVAVTVANETIRLQPASRVSTEILEFLRQHKTDVIKLLSNDERMERAKKPFTRNEEGKWLSPKEFLEQHRGLFSRATLYEELGKGNIPHIRVGKKIFIPDDALEQLLAGQAGSFEFS